MSTETPAVEEQETTQTEAPFALLFELEGIAANGRDGAFEVLKSLLADNNVKLTPAHFSRYCLHPSPAAYVPDLLEALGCKVSAGKLADDVVSGVVMHLSSGKTELQAGLAALLDAAKAKKIPIAAQSSLPESAASTVLSKLGLDKWDVELFATEEPGDEAYPRTDTWLKIARAMNRTPRRCLALVSTHASCRAALSAGINTVVLPDRFTEFQDFGGCDAVLDALTDVPPQELLDNAFPPEEF